MKENLHQPNSLRTYTGQYINLLDPDSSTIVLEDIAIGLARECRFGNHTKHFYSVVEHSLWCLDKAIELYPNDNDLHLKVLLHDAHEAYIKDIPTPLKSLLPGYKEIAKRIQGAIHEKFNVSISHYDKSIIEEIDGMALKYEWFNKVLGNYAIVLTESQKVELFTSEINRLCQLPV